MKQFFILILICIWGYSFSQTKEIESEYYFNKAQTLFDEGKFADAYNTLIDCEKVLGKKNSKILYLSIKSLDEYFWASYDTVAKRAINKMFPVFFDITDQSKYPKEKYFEILGIRDKYDEDAFNKKIKKIYIDERLPKVETWDDRIRAFEFLASVSTDSNYLMTESNYIIDKLASTTGSRYDRSAINNLLAIGRYTDRKDDESCKSIDVFNLFVNNCSNQKWSEWYTYCWGKLITIATNDFSSGLLGNDNCREKFAFLLKQVPKLLIWIEETSDTIYVHKGLVEAVNNLISVWDLKDKKGVKNYFADIKTTDYFIQLKDAIEKANFADMEFEITTGKNSTIRLNKYFNKIK